jgi:D-glycero-D-manno-heptose 1,7-bisphosphate phosphatase
VVADRPHVAVFLDRDGVLNEPLSRDNRPLAPSSLDEFVLVPGVVEACDALRRAGFLLIVVTNQPEIARGTLDPQVVTAMNDVLLDRPGVDEVMVCPHDSADGCECRKPKPGMVMTAAARHGVDISSSFLIGDRWRDVECAHNAGCRAIFLDRGWDEPEPEGEFTRVASLAEAVAHITSR